MKRTIDAKLWKTGNSTVITIPLILLEKFNLKSGDIIEVKISNKPEDK